MLCFVDRASFYSLVNRTYLVHKIFLICFLLFSTCFGKLRARHQDKIPYLCDAWYQSLFVDNSLVCMGGIPPCISNSHLYRVTNTRCRICTVFSPDDGHIVARNMQRKAINTLRKFLYQVDSIYKFINRILTCI